ncbi:MAG: ectoine/hydroxyectoine ABC transporter substrate-binding protein EhuB [SAR324 cluster bacterium]|nr:ectoine/hydroxyectoine ABC transporter substrate-binding protein EhuB [SAR324 cluster bacterium]
MLTRSGFVQQKFLIFVLIFALVCLYLSRKFFVTETHFDRIKKEGLIRVGIANDVPFGYIDSEGNLTGESPEIARKILREFEIHKLQAVLTEFDSLISDLNAGRFDLIAAGMFITPERSQKILFSHPTYCMGQAFLVTKGNPKNLHSYEDIAKHSELTLAVMSGAVEEYYARAVGISESQLLIVPDTPSGYVSVKTGKADALALTSLSINNLVKQDNDHSLESAQPFANPIINGKETKGCGGFGFRKDDAKFLEEFNQHLKSFIGTTEHLKMVKTYGFTEANLPKDLTAEELIKY